MSTSTLIMEFSINTAPYVDLLTLSPGLAPVLHISSCAASNPPTALPSVVEAISLVQRAIESG